MKPQKAYDLKSIKDPEEKEKTLSIQLKSFFDILDSGIRPGDNFDARIIDHTFVSGEDNAINHGLQRVPTGYWVLSRDRNNLIWNGDAAWTKETIYLTSDAATVAKLLIF